MINSKEILADFQFAGNRVSSFSIETKDIETKGAKANVSFDFDYNTKAFEETEEKYIGELEFIVSVKAKVKNAILFKIDLKMDGLFLGNPKRLSKENFMDMLELNGVVTISQLARAYVLSVTSLSGINPPVKLPMINVVALRDKKKSKDKKLLEN